MARKAPNQPEDGGAYTAAVATEDLSQPPLMQPPPIRDATEHGEPAVEVPPPPQYRVVRTQYVMQPGGRTILREGKLIDARSYDLASLRSQGVVLEPVG